MNDKALNLPVCKFVKAYRQFKPVPSNINENSSLEISLPWLDLKKIITNHFSSQSDLKIGQNHALGAFIVVSKIQSFAFHILVYANVEKNKYVVHFKRESGDFFAYVKKMNEIKEKLVHENNTRLEDVCDANISNFRFYLNELNEEMKEETS